ncbi:MAG: cation transporter [Oscillospiraceae bacterium]|nr:cation transporter [Oscillospiraceae bacterium]
MDERAKVARSVGRTTIIANTVLTLVKLLAGIFSRSGAMISDAAHSASDVLSTVIVLIGVRLASKEADREHPFGHERYESVAAIVLAVILFSTGLLIGVEGLRKIVSREELSVPGPLALAAAVVSIIVKEVMYRYTARAAKAIDSDALMADAWHHRSDALSSVGALVGIGGAMLGFRYLDPAASIVISVFVLKAAVDIFRDASEKTIDTSADEKTEAAIIDAVSAVEGVKHIDLLLTREFGSRIYVELEIAVDGEMPLREAHAIAEAAHDKVESAFPQVKHVFVHVNPAQGDA